MLEQLEAGMVVNRLGDRDRNSLSKSQIVHSPLIQGRQTYWQELQRMNLEEEMNQVAISP
jgi:hypothetical protein